MQGKQLAPDGGEGTEQEPADPEAMNMLMHFAQMQMMGGNAQNAWSMPMNPANPPPAYNISVSPPYPANPPMPPQYHPYYNPPQHNLMAINGGYDMNQQAPPNFNNHMPMNSNSGNSRRSYEDDNEEIWSTRPRAANHLSKSALMYLPEFSTSQKSVRNSHNIEQNILKSVEGLLEDDEPLNYDSGFQGKLSSKFPSDKKQVRSVENSGFGTATAKNSSGWSDTTASKMNKTRRSGNESGPSLVTKSFGDSKDGKQKQTPSELSTIFEAKDGLFFSLHHSTSNHTEESKKGRDSDLYEGFKILGPVDPTTPQLGPYSNKQTEPQSQIYRSEFFSKSYQPNPKDGYE